MKITVSKNKQEENFKIHVKSIITMAKNKASEGIDRFWFNTLYSQNLLPHDITQSFVRVLLAELGWNIVIHSRDEIEEAFGIAAAQIEHSTISSSNNNHVPRRLNFVVADAAFLISKTLKYT